MDDGGPRLGGERAGVVGGAVVDDDDDVDMLRSASTTSTIECASFSAGTTATVVTASVAGQGGRPETSRRIYLRADGPGRTCPHRAVDGVSTRPIDRGFIVGQSRRDVHRRAPPNADPATPTESTPTEARRPGIRWSCSRAGSSGPCPSFVFAAPSGWVVDEAPGAVLAVRAEVAVDDFWSNALLIHDRVARAVDLQAAATASWGRLKADAPSAATVMERVAKFGDNVVYLRGVELDAAQSGRRLGQLHALFIAPVARRGEDRRPVPVRRHEHGRADGRGRAAVRRHGRDVPLHVIRCAARAAAPVPGGCGDPPGDGR